MTVQRTPSKKNSLVELVADDSRGSNRLAPDDALVRSFVWNIISINSHLEEIRSVWAKALGITCPQWLILMAVNDMGGGKGVSVREVAAKLRVDPSFVTTQTKSLEKDGFMRRVTSADDARVVLMSLTTKASKRIAELFGRQAVADSFAFADFNNQSLRDITDKLGQLNERLSKTCLRIAADI